MLMTPRYLHVRQDVENLVNSPRGIRHQNDYVGYEDRFMRFGALAAGEDSAFGSQPCLEADEDGERPAGSQNLEKHGFPAVADIECENHNARHEPADEIAPRGASGQVRHSSLYC